MKTYIKKLGLYLEANYKGGMLQYTQAMLEAVNSLPENEFQTTLFYSNRYWKDKTSHYGLKSIRVNTGLSGRWLHTIWQNTGMPLTFWRRICPHVHGFSKTLLEQRHDLWIFPAQNAWSYKVPVPGVVSIFDLNHRYNKHFPEVSANGLFQKREKHYKRICKWARGILVDSTVGKQQVLESYPVDPKKLFVLPYVAPKYILNSTGSPSVKQRYALPSKFIFYPAQFWEHKNHQNLIQAIHILKERYDDISLVLAGSKKNAYHSTLDLIKKLEMSSAVHILGYIPDEDIPEIYKSARAMVMPSYFGPTNIPPLEAIALGCPTAVSDIGAMREQLGNAALFFDPSNISEIAEVVERLWIDDALCSELRQDGFHRANKWDQTHFNDRLHQILKIVLK